MIPALNNRTKVVIKPQSVTAGATVTGTVDLFFGDYAEIDVLLDSEASTSSTPSVLKVSESDDLTTYVDITSCVGGTATSTSVGYVIPNADTANPYIVGFRIASNGARRRYLKVTISPQATQLLGVVAKISRLEETPKSLTERGLAALVTQS